MSNKAIYWFRNNLRLHDNPSLFQALEENDEVLPVVVLPPEESTHRKVGLEHFGDHRKKFFFESIENLNQNLQARGGQLTVLQGEAVSLLTSLSEEYGTEKIYASKEVGWNEVREEVDLPVHLQLILREDQFLISPEEVPFGRVPFGFSSFRKKVEKYWQPRPALRDFEGHFASTALGEALPEIPEVIPDQRSAHPFEGGEDHGLQRLRAYLWDSGQVEQYKFTRNRLLGTEYSSKFSAYLALGCLSPIKIFSEVLAYEQKVKENVSTYWLKFELLWREFFRYVSLEYGHRLFMGGGIQEKEMIWQPDQEKFDQWKEGMTADDFVNANMLELKQSGFMSNRGRQNVASYLVHDMHVDWRWGADYFEKMLVDYDCASNWGNWMYVAGVGNDRRNNKFDTRWQAEKYDGKGAYRKVWLSPSIFK